MTYTPLTTADLPGVYISENTFGAIPASIASHSSCYMLGFAGQGATDTPTFIQSPTDFVNVFGAGSLSFNSVRLFFDQRSGAGLWFVNVAPKKATTVSIPIAPVVGDTYTLTIDGYALPSVIAATGETATDIIRRLRELVNERMSHVATMQDAVIRTPSATTVTSTANITLTTATAEAYPVVGDVIDAIQRSFEPGIRQGYLIAPEFFNSFTSVTDRQTLANAMEAHAADTNYLWVAIADCGNATATQTTAAGALNLALAEVGGMSSPRGHLAFYFPYWKNTLDALVPPSAGVVGVAIRRSREEGFREPPAGVRYPVYGVRDTSIKVTDSMQSVLNPAGVNCIRKLPAGKGTVIYGARTVSTSPYYKFVTTRVIFNVLAGSLKSAYNDVVFSTVDGLGIIFGRIKTTAVAICERLRLAGALYGTTPEEAYLVICDTTNNPAIDLEAGRVKLDVIAKPAPLLEALVINVSRADIGTVLVEVAASADLSKPKDNDGGEQLPQSSTPKAP